MFCGKLFDFAHFRKFNQNPRNLIPTKFNPFKIFRTHSSTLANALKNKYTEEYFRNRSLSVGPYNQTNVLVGFD